LIYKIEDTYLEQMVVLKTAFLLLLLQNIIETIFNNFILTSLPRRSEISVKYILESALGAIFEKKKNKKTF